jgi:hypothetical protein
LLEDLKVQALQIESDCADLIVEYIKQGLKGDNNMVSVSLNENVLEKVNIIARLSKRSLEEVVNDTLWDSLENIVDIPDDFDYSKVGDMLEHDKPEGDDILDNLVRHAQEGWD